jgi:hypothetical protein
MLARTLTLLCLLCFALPLQAAPHLAYIYPPGGQRGATVKMEVHGSDLAGIAGFYAAGSGLTAQIEPGKDAASRVIEIAIAKDAPLGIQQVRVYDANGLSNPKYFCVGELPEMMEKEPNDTQQEAPKVTLPITINGRIQDYADVDGATFHAGAGETVVCEVQGLRVLGQVDDSWLKGYMEIRDAAGNTLAQSEGTSDDYYRWDPLIAFTPPKEGDYTVFFRDLNWRGAAMAVYRLTIGVRPHAIGIFPLGGRRGAKMTVHFSGPNLQNAVQQVEVPSAGPAEPDEMEVAWSGPGGTTNARPFQISDLPDVMQQGPNQTRETAQSVPFPCVVNGRLEKDGACDFYRFHLAKKQSVALDLWSRRLGTPLDSELVLTNAKGDVIRTDDDSRGRDSRIEAELEPGDYVIRVRDVDDRGGPAFPYRLALAETQPRLRVRALPDAPKVARGGALKLDIHVDREDGMNGDVTVTLENPPAGVTATSVTIPKDKQDGQITLTAASTAQPGPVRLQIVGAGKTGQYTLRAIARTEETYNIQGTAFQRELIGPILLITAQ